MPYTLFESVRWHDFDYKTDSYSSFGRRYAKQLTYQGWAGFGIRRNNRSFWNINNSTRGLDLRPQRIPPYLRAIQLRFTNIKIVFTYAKSVSSTILNHSSFLRNFSNVDDVRLALQVWLWKRRAPLKHGAKRQRQTVRFGRKNWAKRLRK